MMTRTAFSVEVNGNETEIDLFSHDKTLLDTFKKSVISGDISRVYEDGNYAIAVYNQDYRLSVGDKIKTGNQELEIVCVTSEGVGQRCTDRGLLGKNLYASDGRVQICYDKRSIEKRCIGGGSK